VHLSDSKGLGLGVTDPEVYLFHYVSWKGVSASVATGITPAAATFAHWTQAAVWQWTQAGGINTN